MKRFLLIFSTLFLISGSLFIQKVDAADPVPKIHFPCDQIADPEFASLRPYQAALCGDADKALYCGSDLIFTESSSTFPECRSQAPDADGEFLCTGIDHYIDDHTLQVDMADSQLPILGNTELTKNSTDTTDQIDDATKVNEYVSWYLNGTINRAEYGENDLAKLADYAGPIQKIMPQVILEAQRIATIASASAEVTYTPENDESNTVTLKQTTERASHDQIVACASPSLLGIVGLVIPHECYDGGGKHSNSKEYRLLEWNGNLSIIRTVTNTVRSTAVNIANTVNNFLNSLPVVGNAVGAVQDAEKNLFNSAVDQVNGIPVVGKVVTVSVDSIVSNISTNAWNDRKPPLPWGIDPNTGKAFTQIAYQRAYMEWRGKTCLIAPIINKLVCFDNPLISNTWADLFPYIPLASTPDKHGSVTDYIAEIKGSGQTEITGSSYDPPKNQPLWFAHTQEVKDLSEFLNKSYQPKGVESVPVPTSTETNKCNVVNVRSNPGDNLFPETPPNAHGVQVGGVHYHITAVPCTVTWVTEEGQIGKKVSREGRRKEVSCHAEVIITLPTTLKSPWLDNIWQSTVSDSGSTFRRIYPKVENGAPVACIADIPGVTDVKYLPTDDVANVSKSTDYEFKWRDPAVGAEPASGTKDDPGHIYFPHLGSVYDYFLKGIQTALRPQGYGEPTPINGQLCSTLTESGDCSFPTNTKVNQAINRAASKYNVPPSLLRAIYEIESYEWINGAETYTCSNNVAGAAGVAQIVRQDNPSDSTYDSVLCSNERMPNDEMMCADYPGKLSRCNVDDAFELMARVLLLKAGLWNKNSCNSTGGISESQKTTWYKAACNYYGSNNPDSKTIGLQNDIPAADRRQNGDMNYCDIVCYKMGQCSGSNYPVSSQSGGATNTVR